MDVPKSSPAPHPTASSTTSAAKAEKRGGGVKDTIESILIAFILAFIFRAFVVEAFVIPTGSMATTLMGAHMKFTCLDCDYQWRVNYNAQSHGDDLVIPSHAEVEVRDSLGRLVRTEPRVYHLICPNCGYRMPRVNHADPDNDATAPPIDFGDRILVLKYLYLFSDPQRWDVVVFKSPYDPKYQTNYIKRLVGKPGEAIMILDGDVYVGAKGQPVEQFKIQTKPHHAQEALWRIVYDNDFQPKSAGKQRFVYDKEGNTVDEDPRWRQPWVQQSGGNGWTIGGAAPGEHAFKFDNTSGAGTLLFDPNPQSLNWPLTNWLGYNVSMDQNAVDSYNYRAIDPPIQVSDLKLQLFYQRQAGDGPLKLNMSKRDDTFTLEITRTALRLMRGDQVLAETAYTAPARPVKVEFMNVDYRVAVRIDGQELLATTPEQYSPKMADLLAAYAAQERPQRRPQVSIEAASQQATLQHVSLWHDVYYTNRSGDARMPVLWGKPDRPMVLADDEFFVLGDNSSNSLDARFWPAPIRLPTENLDVAEGRVPARFMLGKAFFVYWPAGHKIFGTGLVPNVGEMRFIH